MADQTHGGHGQDPLEVDRLLTELESLHALLEEHKRPMAILFTDLKGSTAIFGDRRPIGSFVFRADTACRTFCWARKSSGTVR